MDSLKQDLQTTINAMEKLCESIGSEDLDELLDQLFQQKIDLMNAHLNTGTASFQQATQSMRQAASKSELALKDKQKLREATSATSDAIGKLARLLDDYSPN